MKVLMFGWEFPPHISGGLGTACFGLAKNLAALNVEVIFVVPRLWGDEDQTSIKLIGASEVPVVQKQIKFDDLSAKIDYYELHSGLVPYLGTSEYYELSYRLSLGNKIFLELSGDGKIFFSGEYSERLFQEINDYSCVAEKLATELDFDVIHVHDWMTFPAGIAAKKISGKPLITHVHSTEFDRSGFHVNPTIYETERLGLEAADKVIAVSNYTRNMILRNYYIEQEQVQTVYNAVEQPRKTTGIAVRKKGKQKTVIFAGRITGQKGPEYFVEAARLVLRKMPDVRFVMAGKGDQLNRIVDIVIGMGIHENFEFPGFLSPEGIRSQFFAGDVFVMPSVSEPFGIVALEAAQAGMPVIVSQQSGVGEVLTNAFKVDYWNAVGVADLIVRLLTDEPLRKKMAGKVKGEAKQMKWIRKAAEVKQLYKKLCK